jgi:hypothetical protein
MWTGIIPYRTDYQFSTSAFSYFDLVLVNAFLNTNSYSILIKSCDVHLICASVLSKSFGKKFEFVKIS